MAQALGDGIFALFGAPIAPEDHPQRALYAALRMQEEMRRYAETLRAKGYPPLLLRVGVNTGEVVVRSIRKDDLHTRRNRMSTRRYASLSACSCDTINRCDL